jgi:hypothetical protein
VGWGLDDLWDGVQDFVGGIVGGSGGGAGTSIPGTDTLTDWSTRIASNEWTRLLEPIELPDLWPYLGTPYLPYKTGWPRIIGVEAIGRPGVLPEGTFFIGHASPGMIMESLRMTQGGVPLELDYEMKAGFIARLLQRTITGEVIDIDGYILGVDRESGDIVREDLTLAARSPLRAEVQYGGPIEPYLPLYINISAYGDFASVADRDNLQVQVSATFLCPEVSPTTPAAAPSPESKEPTMPYAIFAPF